MSLGTADFHFPSLPASVVSAISGLEAVPVSHLGLPALALLGQPHGWECGHPGSSRAANPQVVHMAQVRRPRRTGIAVRFPEDDPGFARHALHRAR